MRHHPDCYVYASAFAPTLSLDALLAAPEHGGEPFEYVDSRPGPEDILAFSEGMNALSRFLESLPTREQQILRRFLDGESQADIARTLNVTKMAISKTLAKIYQRGRQQLMPYRYLILN